MFVVLVFWIILDECLYDLGFSRILYVDGVWYFIFFVIMDVLG